MAKKVAVLAVNPVNGLGLFYYLEAFYENGIPYTTFAVAETKDIRTNSGIDIRVDDVVANLKGREDEFDALVFACGDAVPTLSENADKPYNQDMFAVMKAFGDKGKLMIGHCGAGLFFDTLGLVDGKRIALHPYVKSHVQAGIATDAPFEVDGRFFTAQSENTLHTLIPEVIKALK